MSHKVCYDIVKPKNKISKEIKYFNSVKFLCWKLCFIKLKCKLAQLEMFASFALEIGENFRLKTISHKALLSTPESVGLGEKLLSHVCLMSMRLIFIMWPLVFAKLNQFPEANFFNGTSIKRIKCCSRKSLSTQILIGLGVPAPFTFHRLSQG